MFSLFWSLAAIIVGTYTVIGLTRDILAIVKAIRRHEK
jgi:hypothetical protein